MLLNVSSYLAPIFILVINIYFCQLLEHFKDMGRWLFYLWIERVIFIFNYVRLKNYCWMLWLHLLQTNNILFFSFVSISRHLTFTFRS